MRNNRGQPNHTKIIISLTCIPYFKYILYKSGKSTVWGEIDSDEEDESTMWWDTNMTYILSYVYTLTHIHEGKEDY